MGMSTHVLGIRPPDEKWRKMKQVYESCIEMDVEIPQRFGNFSMMRNRMIRGCGWKFPMRIGEMRVLRGLR